MRQYPRRPSLTPTGLVVGHIEIGPDKIVAVARSPSRTSSCPSCGCASARVHSRYQRSLADLPAHGRTVEIKLTVRRFRCVGSICPQKIFAERLGESIAVPFARRTARMESVVHRLGLALGGRPGHSLAERLAIPVSKDTLLRTVRRRAVRPDIPLRAVGIDDWAWRRGCRYGTVVCDLERHRVVALLPDRQGGTAAAWLRGHPAIDFIARDRGASYGEAASKGAPQAIQIADRWHLLENASAAFLDVVRQHIRAIREALASTAIDPSVLTKAERRQWEGFQRRQEATEAVLGLTRKGIPIKQIVRQLGLARMTVRRIVRGGGTDVFRTRISSLEPHLAALDAHWRDGCRNGAELWRRLHNQGFMGSRRVVAEWTTRRRLDETSALENRPRKLLSARQIARLLTIERDHIPREQAYNMAQIERGVPALIAARDLVDRFHAMIRNRKPEELDPWIAAAKESGLSSFATGIASDRDAVRAALMQPWSNGQTEGQITRLKLVKRQMYGRAKLDLLEARLIGGARMNAIELHQN
jgi:transposase